MEYTLTINGREYPARFTVRVAIKAAERRHGTLSAMFQNENEAEFFLDMIWLSVELIKAGATIREKETGRLTEIPTEDEILDTLDQADLLDLQAQMLAVINKDRPTVNTEDPSSKNANATPEL